MIQSATSLPGVWCTESVASQSSHLMSCVEGGGANYIRREGRGIGQKEV